MNVNKLRELTAQAVVRGKELAEKKQEIKARAEEVKDRADQHRARFYIEKIPARAERAARKGLSSVVVMNLTYDKDYTYRASPNHPDFLKGAARIVYDHCMEAGLAPLVTQWDDGVGMKSGYQIEIRW